MIMIANRCQLQLPKPLVGITKIPRFGPIYFITVEDKN